MALVARIDADPRDGGSAVTAFFFTLKDLNRYVR